jgi:uncharacterized protein DUF5681
MKTIKRRTKPKKRKSPSVGYGRPPEHTQFKPGQSGNPKGRPRGTVNMATMLGRTLREKVETVENGRRKTISKYEAALKQLTNKAASGDLSALRLLSALVASAEERTNEATASSPVHAEIDERVVQGILDRFKPNNGGDEDESDTDTE